LVRRPLKISGDADRYEQKRGVDNNYIQPGNLFRLMPPDEQQRIIAAIVGEQSAGRDSEKDGRAL
jgi:catalase